MDHAPTNTVSIWFVGLWGNVVVGTSLLAVEDEPAIRIAQSLVAQHEVADLGGKLGALPLAFQAASLQPLIFRSRRATP